MPWKTAALPFAVFALVAGLPGMSVSAPASKPAAKSAAATPQPAKRASFSGPFLFHGYACAGDCSSHQKGYRWAADHKINNPMDCRGTSETFIEGCRAFAGIDGPMGEREIFQDED